MVGNNREAIDIVAKKLSAISLSEKLVLVLGVT